MNCDIMIWLATLLIGINLILVGFVFFQDDTFHWYEQYILGGGMFSIGVFFAGYAIYVFVGRPKVRGQK